MTLQQDHADLETPTGVMRTFLYRPAAAGRYPGLVHFSEIFQVTGPIRRMAAMLAGHGFVVAVPEIFHEFEPAGTELAYDQEGADRGNRYKVSKTVAAYDADAAAAIAHLRAHPACTGHLGAIGICIGGHLSYRAALHPDIRASACFYATDLHTRSLGSGGDDSLERAPEIKGEMLMIWGQQDPHVPTEGRVLIHQRLREAGVRFTWHEFNGAHAFMRDEGYRYDPALALLCYRMAIDFFTRRLGEGDRETL
jgi:carboxymethylenebutenolidase